jgi:hypothetical protein
MGPPVTRAPLWRGPPGLLSRESSRLFGIATLCFGREQEMRTIRTAG